VDEKRHHDGLGRDHPVGQDGHRASARPYTSRVEPRFPSAVVPA
jgi:hypothetical protein